MDPDLLGILAQTSALSLVIDDLLDIRRIFESEAAALASERANDTEIAALRSVLSEMKCTDLSTDAYCSLDISFHGLINEASHNRILRSFKAQIEGLLRILMNTANHSATANDRLVSIAMHELVFNGIAEHDPARARAAMMAHIQTTERVVRAHFKSGGATVAAICQPNDRPSQSG